MLQFLLTVRGHGAWQQLCQSRTRAALHDSAVSRSGVRACPRSPLPRVGAASSLSSCRPRVEGKSIGPRPGTPCRAAPRVRGGATESPSPPGHAGGSEACCAQPGRLGGMAARRCPPRPWPGGQPRRGALSLRRGLELVCLGHLPPPGSREPTPPQARPPVLVSWTSEGHGTRGTQRTRPCVLSDPPPSCFAPRAHVLMHCYFTLL